MNHGRSRWEPRRWSEADSEAPVALQAALQDAREVTVEGVRVARLAERLGMGSAVGVAGAGVLSGTGLAGTGLAGTGLANTLPPSAAVAYKLWAYLSGVVVVSGVALIIGTQWAAESSESPIDSTIDSAGVALVRDPAVAAVTGNVSAGGLNAARVDALVLTADLPIAAPVAVTTQFNPRSGVGRGVGRGRSNPSVPNRVAVSATLDPEAELAILNRAQDALRQAPRHALTLAEDHARSFPRGVFAQEREVIAIEALMKLQRSDDATERGRAFLSEFPTSTHASRVQQMLGETRL